MESWLQSFHERCGASCWTLTDISRASALYGNQISAVGLLPMMERNLLAQLAVWLVAHLTSYVAHSVCQPLWRTSIARQEGSMFLRTKRIRGIDNQSVLIDLYLVSAFLNTGLIGQLNVFQELGLSGESTFCLHVHNHVLFCLLKTDLLQCCSVEASANVD